MHLLSDNTALRSHVESHLSFMHTFSDKTLDLLRAVSAMNLRLARQQIEGALHASRDIMACSDPLQMVQAAMRQVAPAAERLRSYQQHLMSVLSAGQDNLSGAVEARLLAAGADVSAVAGDVLQHAAAATGVGRGIGNGSASAAGETHH